jgi:hypothetical protein
MLANSLCRLKRSAATQRRSDFASHISGTKRRNDMTGGRSLQRLFLLTFVTAIVSNAASGQAIRGTVVEQGSERPIAAASITLIDEKGAVAATAIADSAGRFGLRPPRAGKYWARAQQIGYVSTLTPVIEFTSTSTHEVTIRMQPRGIPLDTLRVQAERKGLEMGRSQFTRRCGTTEAICLTQARIRNTGARWPTDVFANIPGMAVIDNGRNRSVRSFEGWGCFVIFLNHHTTPMQSRSGGGTLMHMDELLLNDIVGIEIYKSFREVPREFRESIYAAEIWPVDMTARSPSGGCGVARVWTKAAW